MPEEQPPITKQQNQEGNPEIFQKKRFEFDLMLT